MTCREMVECLSGYVDDDLEDALRKTFEEHRGQCPPCDVFMRTLALTVKAVQALPREPLSLETKRALVEALRKARGTQKL